MNEDKRHLIELSQSFEYLRDVESYKATTSTNRNSSKEDSSKSPSRQQQKKSPENLDEMIKFYESKILRLKTMYNTKFTLVFVNCLLFRIDWTNYTSSELDAKQLEYVAQKQAAGDEAEKYFKHRNEQSQIHYMEIGRRPNDSTDVGRHSTSKLAKDNHNLKYHLIGSDRTNSGPSSVKQKARLSKTPQKKAEQSSLIKKIAVISSSANREKSPSGFEKPVLEGRKTANSSAFYSNIKSISRDYNTYDYSSEIPYQMAERTQEGTY